MKYFIYLLLAVSAFGQTTPNLHLNIPPQGTPNYDVLLNQNFTNIDAFLSGTKVLPSISLGASCTTGTCGSNSITFLGSAVSAVVSVDSNGNIILTPQSGQTVKVVSTPVTQTIGSATAATAGTLISTGTGQSYTMTITGATTTDVATCSLNASLPATWQTGIQVSVPIVTANTVSFWLLNPTAGSITPAAATVRCAVTR